MKRRGYRYFTVSVSLLTLFLIYTAAMMLVDVKAIGPNQSSVGFAAVNGWFHRHIGVNMQLYMITDWAGVAAIAIAMGFGLFGLVQLIKRKSLKRVDVSILALGAFYLLVFFAYLFFEFFVVNYRPVLIDGILEASYPSSTTMLVMCVMPTAMHQFHRLIPNKGIKRFVNGACGLFAAFMVGGRLLSGVHWVKDILGGVLLSAALGMLYLFFNELIDSKINKENGLPRANE